MRCSQKNFVRLLIYLTKSLSNDSKLSQEESKQFIRGNYQKCQNFHEHFTSKQTDEIFLKTLIPFYYQSAAWKKKL